MLQSVGIRTRSVIKCAYCNTDGQVQHQNLTDRLFGAPGTWSVRRCPKCQLGWADPQPIIEDIGKLYANYFTHETGAADAQISSPGKRAIKRLAAFGMPWRSKALLSDCRYLARRKPGRLLDVGCGGGAFLAGMAKRGWNCTGVEFDEDAVTAARKHGLTVHHGSLEEQRFSANSFDGITLSNVIEHLPDPAGTFAELRRILAPGGRLVLITPNINSLGHSAFGRCWRGLEPPRHLFLFNRKTLGAFAERAGLKIDGCFTVPGNSSGILEASLDMWKRKPRDYIPSIRSLKAWELIKTLVGSSEGEFVVLLAGHR